MTDKALFLTACWEKRTRPVPIWFMRQAGRFLPEYRKLREKYSFQQLIHTPELAAQVTLLPEHLGVDALIVFSDISVVFDLLGVRYKIVEGKGPVVERHALPSSLNLEALYPVAKTIQLVKGESHLPVIGLAPGPLTALVYLIGRDEHLHTLRIAFAKHKEWCHRWLEVLTHAISEMIKAQVQAGADAIQIFDTWMGLAGTTLIKATLPYLERSIPEGIGVPLIYFTLNTQAIACWLQPLSTRPTHFIVGVDWRSSLALCYQQAKASAVQGNLDPIYTEIDCWQAVENAVKITTNDAASYPWIFNVGHGLSPRTNITTLQKIIDLVRKLTA